jgi:uncharacterized protein YdbL (DUF1318 family)
MASSLLRAGWIFCVNLSSNHFHFRPAHWPAAGFLISVGCLSGCAPTINLATPKPITLDIGVRLDIYQKTPPTKANSEQSAINVAKNRRLRSGEIQQLKNDHVIGEDRDGLLEIRNPPKDPKYLAYANQVVSDENADRSFLYLNNAQAQNKPLESIESEYAQLWASRAFPGEWIQKEDGTWTQK